MPKFVVKPLVVRMRGTTHGVYTEREDGLATAFALCYSEAAAQRICDLLNGQPDDLAVERARVVELVEACQAVVRMIESHQVYDKDVAGVLQRVINSTLRLEG